MGSRGCAVGDEALAGLGDVQDLAPAARIVNVSSEVGSITAESDPAVRLATRPADGPSGIHWATSGPPTGNLPGSGRRRADFAGYAPARSGGRLEATDRSE